MATALTIALLTVAGMLGIALWRTRRRLAEVEAGMRRLEALGARVEPELARARDDAQRAEATARRAAAAAGVEDPPPRVPLEPVTGRVVRRRLRRGCAAGARPRHRPALEPAHNGTGHDETVGVMGRLVWLAMGIGIGVAVTRHVGRSTSNDGSPLGAAAAAAARRARRAVDAAIAEGRNEMHEREARLRAVLAAPPRTSRGTGRGGR